MLINLPFEDALHFLKLGYKAKRANKQKWIKINPALNTFDDLLFNYDILANDWMVAKDE